MGEDSDGELLLIVGQEQMVSFSRFSTWQTLLGIKVLVGRSMCNTSFGFGVSSGTTFHQESSFIISPLMTVLSLEEKLVS